MMVAKLGKTSRVGWGALLVLAQLLAFGILPSLHVATGLHPPDVAAVESAQPSLSPADGDHAPTRPHGGHDESACQYCRLTDARFALEPAAAPASPVAESLLDVPQAASSWRGATAVLATHAPRAPPPA
jgi:hypothetical protein